MKSADRFALVLVTAPDLKAARRLAQAALKSRLAACANLIPRIESHYWWQGKLERGLCSLKLRRRDYPPWKNAFWRIIHTTRQSFW